MPYVTLPGGHRAHIKVAKPRRTRCSIGNCPFASTRLCDYAIGAGRTCDARLCDVHATSAGPDIDHCPTHAKAQSGLFTELIP